MKTYIVSLVLAMKLQVLAENGHPDISIQNEVMVLKAEDAQVAYNVCAPIAKAKAPRAQYFG